LLQDPIELIVKTIEDIGLSEKRIGVEIGLPRTPMLLSVSEFDAIRKALPKAEFENAVNMIWKQRMIKTAWEQDIIRKLVNITIRGWKKAIESAHEGMTEEGLLKICWKFFIEEGACDTPMAGDVMFKQLIRCHHAVTVIA